MVNYNVNQIARLCQIHYSDKRCKFRSLSWYQPVAHPGCYLTAPNTPGRDCRCRTNGKSPPRFNHQWDYLKLNAVHQGNAKAFSAARCFVQLVMSFPAMFHMIDSNLAGHEEMEHRGKQGLEGVVFF